MDVLGEVPLTNQIREMSDKGTPITIVQPEVLLLDTTIALVRISNGTVCCSGTGERHLWWNCAASIRKIRKEEAITIYSYGINESFTEVELFIPLLARFLLFNISVRKNRLALFPGKNAYDYVVNVDIDRWQVRIEWHLIPFCSHIPW